ncbi:MAG: hypothetical protein ABH812_01340 [bacterium]
MSVEILRTSLNRQVEPRFRSLYEAGRLEELLDPNPQDVAQEVFRIIFESSNPTVINLFSLSMFSGKTTAAIDFAYLAKQNGLQVIAVQPKSGLRHGKLQEKQITTHKQQKYKTLSATLTNPNLLSVVNIAEEMDRKKIESRPILIIDEAMLYLDNTDNPQEAEECVERIRLMGIDVVTTGIIRNFKAEPFVVMNHLVEASSRRENWDNIQMTTQCAFCTERAKGTARYIFENGEIKLAPYKDPEHKPGGDDSYAQVCIDVHKSCSV